VAEYRRKWIAQKLKYARVLRMSLLQPRNIVKVIWTTSPNTLFLNTYFQNIYIYTECWIHIHMFHTPHSSIWKLFKQSKTTQSNIYLKVPTIEPQWIQPVLTGWFLFVYLATVLEHLLIILTLRFTPIYTHLYNPSSLTCPHVASVLSPPQIKRWFWTSKFTYGY
jgi:hypothetical protein